MKETMSYMDTYRIVKEPSTIERKKIIDSYNAQQYIRKVFDDIEIYESFYILLLNQSNVTIGYQKISQGGQIGTVVDLKFVVKYAIDAFAQGVILFHNHPSGNTKPSEADKSITGKIKDALKLYDISLLDHIIITKDSFLSMGDEGLI